MSISGAGALFRSSLRTALLPKAPFCFHRSILTSNIGRQIQQTNPTFPTSTGLPKIHKMTLITINQSITDRLRNDGVIPDVVDEFTPSVFLQAEFPSGKEMQLGNTLDKEDTQDQPKIIVTPGERASVSADTKYTLCLTDPDAVSRDDPKWAEFCHWLVTDIPAKTGPLEFKESKELMEFMGPAPPEKTGKHRYVLLLFKNGKDEPEKPQGRKKWGWEDHEGRIGARHFAKKYGLELVGANFFFCQHEKQEVYKVLVGYASAGEV